MQTSLRFCRAGFWIKTAGGNWPILPLRGFALLLVFIGITALVAFIAERPLEIIAKKGEVNSLSWVEENRLISSENYKKMLNTIESPLFRSLGYSPPPIDCGSAAIAGGW